MTHPMLRLLFLLLVPALATAAPATPERMTISVNQADLKDVLRAATADTDLNLVFEPGLDLAVQGLNLKAMTLDEILDAVLPRLGLACTREGRNLYIHASESTFRFYHVDLLAMTRNGTKTYQVNESGQAAGVGTGAGAGGASSAYTSSIQVGQASDPWADLENGLMLLVFGKLPERTATASSSGGSGGSGGNGGNGAGRAGGSDPGGGVRGHAAGGRTLLIQPGAGLVAVGADAATQRRVEAYLREARQRSQRQVQLEARIVEVALGDDSQMGVDWQGLLQNNGNPSGVTLQSGATQNGRVAASQGLVTLVAQRGRVQATLTALARNSRLKVLSAPRLSTLNNQKAILRVVTDQVYALFGSQITPGAAGGSPVAAAQVTPMVVPVGIVLDVQPEIGDDGTITLAVSPSITEVTEEKAITGPSPQVGAPPLASTTLPVVARRDLDAVVRVPSGETLVLAGIISTREHSDSRGVPWLRKVPILGALFAKNEKSASRTELAIFLTPTLMDEPAKVAAEAAEAGKRLEAAEPGRKGLLP
jgi:MSHA type pilus biogenesis protein MshL